MEFFLGIFDNDEFRKLDFLREEETRITKVFEDKKKELKAVNMVGRFDYFIKYNLGVDAFKNYLIDNVNTATIFHFSGHHGHSEFQLADKLVNDSELITLLNNSDSLKLVFLNGCETQKVINKLDQVPIVIGTEKPINDNIAMEVSTSFYKLLIEDLDNLLYLEQIEKRFNQAKAVENLIQKGKERGEGGWSEIDANEKGNNYIFKINKDRIADFADRMLNGLDLATYPANEKYKQILESWFETNELENELEYERMNRFANRYFPKPLAHFLQKIEPETGKEKYLVMSEARFEAIQGLYLTLLTFLKCCGFSFMWDHLLLHSKQSNGQQKQIKELDENLKKKLKAELGDNWYESKPIENLEEKIIFLKTLFQKIGVIFPEIEFGAKCEEFLTTHEETLTSFCKIFSKKSDLSKQVRYLKAESFLQFFLKSCCFLRKYELVSVHDSKYYKYKITDDLYHYTLRFFPKGGENREEIDGPIEQKLYDVYSIVLVEKTNEVDKDKQPKPVLNLSPFYVDENILDEAANIINLACLACYSYKTQRLLYFNLEAESMTDPKSLLHHDSNNQLQVFNKTKINDHIKELIKTIE